MKYNRTALEEKLFEENQHRCDKEKLKDCISKLLNHMWIVFDNRSLVITKDLVRTIMQFKDSNIETCAYVRENTLRVLARSGLDRVQATELLTSMRFLARVLNKDPSVFAEPAAANKVQESSATCNEIMFGMLSYLLVNIQKPPRSINLETFFHHSNVAPSNPSGLAKENK